MLADVGLALGGRAGERMTRQLDALRSRTTLLSLIQALPVPAPGPLRVVGVDEFALRRAHTYGAVLVDMETQRPVDVLPDRTAETLAAWAAEPSGHRGHLPRSRRAVRRRRSSRCARRDTGS